MTALEFRNAILLLNCIDADEFGGIQGAPQTENDWLECRKEWRVFHQDPVNFYIRCGERYRNALWAIIEKRLTIGESND